jgi:hypothetical protein
MDRHAWRFGPVQPVGAVSSIERPCVFREKKDGIWIHCAARRSLFLVSLAGA